MLNATKTDLDNDWTIVDNIVHLREWGGEHTISLPKAAFAEELIGASPSCSVQLDDDSRRVSREHARLVRNGALWTIHDLASKNGTWIDGARRASSTITPGTEIRLGGIVLVAESDDLAALRALLCRWIGWGADQRGTVDRALRAVREAFTERTPLLLCGEGDLTSIAARLHRQTLGRRPFVVHAGRGEVNASILLAAARGTLCIASAAKHHARVAASADAHRVRLVVCSRSSGKAAAIAIKLGRAVRIEIPRLADRAHEIGRILREYADEEASRLGAVSIFEDRDLAILATHKYRDLAEIEDNARRLVVLRALGVRPGAKVLGISHPAFSRWATRRGLTPPAT